MKDCCNQDIVPIPGRQLSVHTNVHPNCDGTSWGWIEGCTLNICWSNNTAFNKEMAIKFVNEHNKVCSKNSQ